MESFISTFINLTDSSYEYAASIWYSLSTGDQRNPNGAAVREGRSFCRYHTDTVEWMQ